MSISTSGISIRNIPYINGIALETRKAKAYSNSRGLPIIQYGDILSGIELEISNYIPNQLLHEQVKKYTTEDNLYLVEVSDKYKFRPDLLSHIFYGSVEYFHIILILNQMKSFLEFLPDKRNNLIFMFKEDIIDEVITF